MYGQPQRTQEHVRFPGHLSRSRWLQVLPLLVRRPRARQVCSPPRGRPLSLPAGVGREAVVTDTWQSYTSAHTHSTRRRERGRAKKDSGLDPNHWSFHFMKESECLGSLQYVQCSAFSGARPEPRTTPQQGTMYRIYRESLQKSLLHPTTKCTLWCTCLRSENRDRSVCPPHPRDSSWNQREQMLARAFGFPLGYTVTLGLGKKKKVAFSPFGKILFKTICVRNLGDSFLLALEIVPYYFFFFVVELGKF